MQVLPKKQIAGRFGYNCYSYNIIPRITAVVIFKYLWYDQFIPF